MVAGGDNTAHKQWLEQFVKSDAAFATDESVGRCSRVVNDLVSPRSAAAAQAEPGRSAADAQRAGPRDEPGWTASPVPYEYEHYDDVARQRVPSRLALPACIK